MPLTMRPTGLASAAYRHLQDWPSSRIGRTVGRIIEDSSANTPVDRRWSWSIVVYVHPMSGIVTSGRAATLRQAKAEFQRNLGRGSAPSSRDFGAGRLNFRASRW